MLAEDLAFIPRRQGNGSQDSFAEERWYVAEMQGGGIRAPASSPHSVWASHRPPL